MAGCVPDRRWCDLSLNNSEDPPCGTGNTGAIRGQAAMRRFLEDQVWGDRCPRNPLATPVRSMLRIPEALYSLAVRMRNLAFDRGLVRPARAPIPIVSIGGIEAGGVGKTPLAIELARLAREAGMRPAILTRGYGRRMQGGGRVQRVDPAAALRDWKPFGDEPVLLAESAGADVWVARLRRDAAKEAAERGADVAILDDGFQHRVLGRDLDILCVDARRPLGNGRMLPAGPLRENPARALLRADRIVLTDGAPDVCAETAVRLRRLLGDALPILSWHGEHSLHALLGEPPRPGESVLITAGIARPHRLVDALEGMGHPVAGQAFFQDHHPFSPRHIERILQMRSHPAMPIVTTEKDWIRLRCSVAGSGGRWAVLRRRLVWNEAGAGESWIRDLRELSA